MPPFEILHADDEARFAAAGRLFREYAGALGVDLGFQGFDEELGLLPRMYGPPHGALLLARRAGGGPQAWLGCVAVRRLADHDCEMKRLYVRDQARGLGLGRALGEAVIGTARALGYRQMLLDTLESMAAARALYVSLGFVETGAYYDNPLPGVRYLRLAL